MANSALVGAGIGTAVMPGVGTVGGAMVGGLVGLFSGPEAQQQSANVGGQTIDARRIWETISAGNSQSVRGGAAAAADLQSVHDQRSQQIDTINQAMDAAWQGDASQQVQAGAHPLGIWLQDSASNLNKSHTYLGNQADDFDNAQSTVQEIAATPPHAGFMDHVNPFSDKDDEIKKYNEQGQTNVQAFNAYYQASAQNAAGMPQYSAWQGNTFSDGDGTGDDGNGPGSGHTGNIPGTGGGYQPGGTGGIPGGGTGNIPGYGSNIPGAGGTGGSGSGGGYQPNVPGYHDPSSTDPGTKSPSWNDGTAAASYTPDTSGTDFGTGGFGPTGSGFGSGGGSGSGSGSGAGGSGVGGGGSLGGFGPAGSGSLGSGASTGAGAGAGSGAAGGFRGATAGGAGAAGRGGASGMSGMGQGGRGKGSDDEEHQTKYLVSEDPNELFGTDELTAPPVIGE
jgi:hypothetical protein